MLGQAAIRICDMEISLIWLWTTLVWRRQLGEVWLDLEEMGNSYHHARLTRSFWRMHRPISFESVLCLLPSFHTPRTTNTCETCEGTWVELCVVLLWLWQPLWLLGYLGSSMMLVSTGFGV